MSSETGSHCQLMQKKRQLTPYMNQSLIAVLLPEYRRRVLGLLLLHPDEQLHGREIARRTGLPAGTITRELGKLTVAGILQREKRGNQQLYRADKSCPVFTELASILRKTSGVADVLAAALEPIAEKIDTAFIYGSVAQGRETAGSDIDLMLIGDLGFDETIRLLWPLQAELGREINPHLLSRKEFAVRAQEPYMRDVLSKPKIFVMGNEDELAEFTGHQS